MSTVWGSDSQDSKKDITSQSKMVARLYNSVHLFMLLVNDKEQLRKSRFASITESGLPLWKVEDQKNDE
jgi:hypothetical protein